MPIKIRWKRCFVIATILVGIAAIATFVNLSTSTRVDTFDLRQHVFATKSAEPVRTLRPLPVYEPGSLGSVLNKRDKYVRSPSFGEVSIYKDALTGQLALLCNSSAKQYLCRYICPSGNGLDWVMDPPRALLGTDEQGFVHGDWPGVVAHGDLCYADGIYWYVFSDDQVHGNFRYATSTDGVTWIVHPDIVMKHDVVGGKNAGNACLYHDKDGWVAMLEVQMTDGNWVVHGYTGKDLSHLIPLNKNESLSTLKLPSGTDTYGGCNLHRVDGKWVMFYHYAQYGDLPTYIACATSDDLVNWVPRSDPAIVFTPNQDLEKQDQVGDVCIFETTDPNTHQPLTLVAYGVVNNTNMIGAMVFSSIPESLSELLKRP